MGTAITDLPMFYSIFCDHAGPGDLDQAVSHFGPFSEFVKLILGFF
jgi:hypothetical protein